MTQTFIQSILQILGVLDGLTVALILGSITILTICEITRLPHQEIDRGMTVSRKVLGFAIITQAVFRSIDIITTINLVRGGQIAWSDIPSAYVLTLIMTVAAVGIYIAFRLHKVQTALFVFLETALWYTMFMISQFFARAVQTGQISGAALTLLSVIVVILLLLLADTAKRYYHKKSKK